MPGPEFLVVGAAKAATTSLCVTLQRHPEIFIPQKKELNFFSHDEVYLRGADWYHEHFADTDKRVCGEGSVSYSFCDAHPDTAERIKAYHPGMKLIYIVRDPVQRLISLYRQFQAAGVIGPVSLAEALGSYPMLLDSARYWKQISRYRSLFPDSQIQVLFFEDWKNDPAYSLRQCCEFLNVACRTDLLVKCKTQTLGQRYDTQPLWLLRQVPGFATFRELLPSRLRAGLKRMMKTKITSLPPVHDDTLLLLRQELNSDLQQFLEYSGRPGFWTIERPAVVRAA